MHLPILLLALLVACVAAQNSSSIWSNMSSAPQCILENCHSDVASFGNCSSTDMICICKMGVAAFAQLTLCVQSNCADSTSELSAFASYLSDTCSRYNISLPATTTSPAIAQFTGAANKSGLSGKWTATGAGIAMFAVFLTMLAK